jgi:PIN domain nuclease of toxin-antitoxin system
MSEPVLDASAILAYLQEEPGQDAVADVLAKGPCPVCAVNLSEAAAKLVEIGLSRNEAPSVLEDLDLAVHPFDEMLALECAWFRAPTKSAGLSLGDRACLALAKRLSRPAWTTDRGWAALSLGVEVRVIRP